MPERDLAQQIKVPPDRSSRMGLGRLIPPMIISTFVDIVLSLSGMYPQI